MSWGVGPWGAGAPWGTGSTLPPPTLISVSSDPGATAPSSSPAVVDVKGGTVCQLFGTNFFDPVTVEIGLGTGGGFIVLGEGYVFEGVLDVRRNRVYFGSPRLVAGLYSVRVTTEGGTSGVLEDVIAARLFADEFKVVSVRGKYSAKWATGPRILREG